MVFMSFKKFGNCEYRAFRHKKHYHCVIIFSMIVRHLTCDDFCHSDKPMEKPFQSQSCICERCLVGWNVPVYRSLKQGWEFANVTAFKEETQHHNVRFIDDETAWMRIEPNPFDEYVTFCVNLISSADDGNRNSIGGPNRNGANDISGNNSNDDFDHGGGGDDENWPLQFEDDSVNGNVSSQNQASINAVLFLPSKFKKLCT